MSLETCHPASPRRAGDWRWGAATCLRNGLLPAHPAWLDSWVERVVAFQDALGDCEGIPHHPRLDEEDSELAAAYGLHLDEDRPTRWHVEALLLAGEGDGPIAGRCGIPAGVVAAYAAVFFDVSRRLEQTSYILHHAINVNHCRPGRDVGRAWKMLGYGGRPLVVDFMAAGAVDTGGLSDLAVVGPVAPQERHARLRHLAVAVAVAALTLELDPADARRLALLIRATEEVDREASSAASRPIDGGFAAMVAGLDLTPRDPGRGDGGPAARVGFGPPSDVPGGIVAGEGPEDRFEAAPLRNVGL